MSSSDYRFTPEKARKHFLTITKHKLLVMKHCFRCGLYLQGLTHDLSKYSPIEFVNGVRYFQGTCSPTEAERKDRGASHAWMHHKGRNRHHYEYWTDYMKKPGQVLPNYGPVDMPNRYILEMFCDRVAAAKVYHPHDFDNSIPLRYLTKNQTESLMTPETARKLTILLELYQEKGDEAFDLVRAALKKHRKCPV